jgi:uncharacterized membrane protein YdbT with pleckstrin-like domain
MATQGLQLIWKDKKRYLGLPVSFTRYGLSEDRLFLSTGFLTLKDEELLLYRIRDITVQRTLTQRLFGVGTVIITSSDKSNPILELKNIRSPLQVKELLHAQVEEMKDRRRVRYSEIASYNDDMDDELDAETD